MWALDEVYRSEGRSWAAGTPLGTLGSLVALAAATGALAGQGWLPGPAATIATVTGVHGALLATALAWADADGRPDAAPAQEAPNGARWALIAPAAVLAIAAGGTSMTPFGFVSYLAVPLVLWRLGRDTLLPVGPGHCRPPLRAVAAGALVGLGLGGHLIVAAWRAFGHHAGLDAGADWLRAVAYDIGANVLSTECFFRGALFRRLQGITAFRVAVVVSTGASVLRYLIDPLFSAPVGHGMALAPYVAVLGVASCWLLRWTGSLVPGYVAGVAFFAAYRLLDLR